MKSVFSSTQPPKLGRGSGPVFIHAEACTRYDALALPPDFRALPLVFEAYEKGGRLLAQERVGVQAPEETLEEIFDRTGADYVHVRNGEAGCFMAKVERYVARD